jgi:hypothetical protein
MPKKTKFNLPQVKEITSGKQARGRKQHNQSKPQPGEIFEAQSPPAEQDRLDRALLRSYESEQTQKEASKDGKPRPGEVLSAQNSQEAEKEIARVKAFLRQAQDRWQIASEAEATNRKNGLDDLEFRAGKQWPDDIRTERDIDKRPCLTMNHMPQYIRQVTNEGRQQRPAIQINPVGDGADQDTAEVLQGMVRHIEVNSDAEVAYDTAFEHMVTSGWGFWRIITDWIGQTFDQEILIKRIKNPFCVYFDPAAIEADYSDARFAFVIEDVPISEYREQYKDTEAAGLADFSSIGDSAADWATKDTIRVAEYFHIEEEFKTLVQLDNGEIMYLEEVPENKKVINKRTCIERKVMWSKINAIEVIEEREWPGQWIPIVPVLGDDLEVDGQRHLIGLVRNLKDPQRMYNYWVSAATEMIALAPKAPNLVAEGATENHEVEWSQSNTRNLATLTYKAYDSEGRQLPTPVRNVYEPPVQAINLMTRQADNDMKAGAGIYDASLGQKGPDQSGKAILARQKQTDISILNYSDNLARSIRHTGRLLIDLIPHIYSAPRVQRIVNPDQTTKYVGVFNSQQSEANPSVALQGQAIQKIYDVGVGRYDVSVSVGPSYQSRRQEAVASELELAKAYPPLMGIAGDLIVGNMDWPQSKQIAERIKKTLPPNVLDDNDQDPASQLQRARAQLGAISQQHELLTKALEQATETINTKRVEQDTKLQIAKLDQETKLAIAEITTKAQEAQTRLKMEQDLWNQFHGSAHEVALSKQDHTHTLEQTDQAHVNAQDLAAQQAAMQPEPQGASQ